MSLVDDKKHPFIAALDVLIFLFAISELVEAVFHVGLGYVIPESALQIVIMVLRGVAVWHAGRHLKPKRRVAGGA
jgi:hypothetical protein